MKTEIEKITILPGVNKFGEKEKFEKIEIKKGEIVAIVGPTGAGKSQILYDIEKLAQGDSKSKRVILVNNEKADKELRFDPKRKLIASLAQSMNFLTDISVKDFLILHLKARGKIFDSKLIKEVINKALKKDLKTEIPKNIEETIKYYQAYAEKNGFKLNPDKEAVERLIRGLLENEKKHGARYCPCRRISGNQEEDKPKICPCQWHREEIERDGHCFCGLFYK